MRQKTLGEILGRVAPIAIATCKKGTATEFFLHQLGFGEDFWPVVFVSNK